ncbi:MAG: histidinol-phosphate transaminase [Gammaproteobacteria bacterium]|nr:MAG: histidinol-phosphate transaminase [Pseudomonadota bacterium]PIE38211.1 MAG: histidinol-phosphate transaminase [Gammaproteobacteria bacterium]
MSKSSADRPVYQRVRSLVRPEIASLDSYHVQSSKGMIKLDAMENPFAWPGDLEQQWLDRLGNASLNRYPDPVATELSQSIRHYFGVPDELGVMLGNGSDELIQIIAMAVAQSGRTILAPEPGFVMYRMIAAFVGMRYVGVPLAQDFTLDVPAMLAAIRDTRPALVFLAQPNNPTGNLFGLDATKQIIEASEGLVVIDEAYLPFTKSDLLHLASDYENVVVMRTFSKMGLAGLRLGILVGDTAWLSEFDKVRLPYNINSLTQMSARFALDHIDVLERQAEQLCDSRRWLMQALGEIDGLEAFPSEANFILVRLPARYSARDIFEGMKCAGVLVKCMDGAHPLLANCLRLTVGLPEENSQMMEILKSVLSTVGTP